MAWLIHGGWVLFPRPFLVSEAEGPEQMQRMKRKRRTTERERGREKMWIVRGGGRDLYERKSMTAGRGEKKVKDGEKRWRNEGHIEWDAWRT